MQQITAHCFSADALFRLPNGDLRAARRLEVGSEVCAAVDGFWDTYATVISCHIRSGCEQDLICLVAGKAYLTVTSNHRICAKRRSGASSSVIANQLVQCDVVRIFGGTGEELTSVTRYTMVADVVAIRFSRDLVVEAYPPVQATILSKGERASTRSRMKQMHLN